MKVIIAIFLLTLPLACSNNISKSEDYDYEVSAAVDLDDSQDILGLVGSPDLKQANQKLIKTSILRFETQNMEEAYKNVASIVSKYKGYIQDDNETKGYNRFSRQLIIRLPTENFQKSIESISKNVAYFDEKRINSKDVTEEFIDLEARLKAKKTLEARYLEILKKAKTVKEILEIELELSAIREEIEAKQGRLKYLNNQVSLSTINIEFYKTTVQSSVTQSYGKKMWNAIQSGFNGLSIFFLGILHIWPFVIILVVAFFIIKKRYFKKK